MKLLYISFALISLLFLVLVHSRQDIQRYSYHVWGTVLDEESRTMSRLTVCFIPSERPINGRIPCSKTGDEGKYSMTVKEIPDKYTVCASTTDSPFVFVNDPDPTHRVTCSKPLQFGAADDSREVNLKFAKRQR